MDLKMTKNPYGETKAMAERILKDYSKTNQNLSIYIFRYFNPIGAHKSGLIGENPNGIPNNIMPVILKVAKGEIPELKIFGNDYNTLDGTGVRDYIHVKDLAAGHISALKKRKPGFNVYNLGTGKGSSVLELVNCFETENHVDVKYVFTKRREGDIDVAFADASKAARELDWTAKLTLKEMVKDAWRYKNIYGGKNEN
jgi:UDP-glucose 4-epimerase